jgi:hypothetical protein
MRGSIHRENLDNAMGRQGYVWKLEEDSKYSNENSIQRGRSIQIFKPSIQISETQ